MVSTASHSSKDETPLLPHHSLIHHQDTWSFTPPLLALGMFVICEKASSTGLSAVMLLYFMQMLNWSPQNATLAVQILQFSSNICTPIAGYLSDLPHPFGRLRTASVGFLIYGLAFVFFTLSAVPCAWDSFPELPGSAPLVLFLFGLIANAIGSSADKAIVPSLLGDQCKMLERHVPRISQRIYRWQAICSNMGPVLLGGVVPYLHTYGIGKEYGGELVGTSYYYSFALCTATFFIGWACFISQLGHYEQVSSAHETAQSSPMAVHLIRDMIRSSYFNYKQAKGMMLYPLKDSSRVSILAFCDDEYKETAVAVSAILRLIPFTVGIMGVFMALYSQYAATVVVQAAFMARPIWYLPEHTAVIGGIVPVLLAPIVDWFIDCLQGWGMELGPHRRIRWGFMCVIVSFVYLVGLQGLVQETGRYVNGVFTSPVSVWWQLPFTILFSCAVLICGCTVMELLYASVPDCAKGVALSLYYIGVANGSLISIFLTPLMTEENLEMGFSVLLALMVMAAILHRLYFEDPGRKEEGACQNSMLKYGSQVIIDEELHSVP